MADFTRQTLTFDLVGIDLARPVDQLPPGFYRIAENVRPYGTGQAQGRQGITQVSLTGTTGDPVHSIVSFDDPIPDPTRFPDSFQPRFRIMGTGTTILGAGNTYDPNAFIPMNDGVNIPDTPFSGKPLTFALTDSDFSPRPWCYIGDFNQMRKVNSNAFSFHMGIAPPNFAPTAAIDAANPDGPDVGASPNPYIYAWRARADYDLNTGCVSNLGPAIRMVNGLSPSSSAGAPIPPSNILVTLAAAHPDPSARYMDLFRWGGSLPTWLYIGTVSNTAGNTVLDTFNDIAIASNEQADLDDNQPFLSVDTGKWGHCSITPLGAGLGCTMTVLDGDVLKPWNAQDAPYYPAGTQVSISGTVFTFYRSPDSATSVELLEDGGPDTGLIFTISAPELCHQPVPCIWGPFGGGLTGIFLFACGDPLNPGSIYWTKGNHPESHPGANTLEITSGAEPMMNGTLYDGNPYVFSTKRMFTLYPTLGQISDFTALEIPNSKGLFARWGMCVTPIGIAFVAKDGIYLSSGGPPTSLTDDHLYPIFPHEGIEPSAFSNVDGNADSPFSPPDFTQPDTFRLAFGDGFLYFDYIDQSGTYRTLVYNLLDKQPGWVSRDTYSPQVISRYFENVHSDADPTKSWSQVLMGGLDGNIWKYGGDTDGAGAAIAGHLRTGAWDDKDQRPRKFWGDIEIDLDALCDTFDVEIGFDNYSYFSQVTLTGTNITGRRRVTCDINAGLGQYAYNIGLDITWSVTSGQPLLYWWIPTVIPKPELTALRTTDWDDDGYQGAKFVQGFILRADTLNQTRQIQVLSDGGVLQQTFSMLHPNEQEIAYWFTTPFITHLLRFLPADAKFWRYFKPRWIWNPAPELAGVWTTQETTHDLEGYFFHRDFLPALVSTGPVNLRVTVNGNPGSPFNYTIPSTGGLFLKQYMALQAMKAREVQYSLTGDPFRMFVKDSEVRVKQWGSTGPFLSAKPFGDVSRESGAKI